MKMMSKEKLEKQIRELFKKHRIGYEKALNELEKQEFTTDDVKKVLSKYLIRLNSDLHFYGLNESDLDISKFISYSDTTDLSKLVERIYKKNQFNIENDNTCIIKMSLIDLDFKIINFLIMYEIYDISDFISGNMKFWDLDFINGQYKNNKIKIKTYKRKNYVKIEVL